MVQCSKLNKGGEFLFSHISEMATTEKGVLIGEFQ